MVNYLENYEEVEVSGAWSCRKIGHGIHRYRYITVTSQRSMHLFILYDNDFFPGATSTLKLFCVIQKIK